MNYKIGYNDRNGLNHGRIVKIKESRLENVLFDTVLSRIGASLIYSTFSFSDMSYKASAKQGIRYQGVFWLMNEKDKRISFPTKIHNKLINNK